MLTARTIKALEGIEKASKLPSWKAGYYVEMESRVR